MLPCHWHEDRDGTRYLIPGCAGRVNDPDGDGCTCPTLAEQLAEQRAAAQSEIAQLRRSLASCRSWHDHVVGAVNAHPAGRAIMRAAAERAEAAERAAAKQPHRPST